MVGILYEKRVSPLGRVTHRYRVRDKSLGIDTSFSRRRKADAKNLAEKLVRKIEAGDYFRHEAAKTHTLAEAMARYRAEILPHLRPSTVKANSTRYDFWEREYGHLALAQVNKILIREIRDALPCGNTTKNRYIQILYHVLRLAVEDWEWLENHPLQGLKSLPQPKGVVRFLSTDEKGRLLDACREAESPDIYDVVLLGLQTGGRKGEILGLSWLFVDLERAQITFADTKNGDNRTLPLPPDSLDMLARRAETRESETGLVFPGKLGDNRPDLKKSWTNALKRAGVENFRFHDLRHTYASYLAMSGARLREIQELLGHRTLNMVQRYAHLCPAHNRAVVERMAAKFL